MSKPYKNFPLINLKLSLMVDQFYDSIILTFNKSRKLEAIHPIKPAIKPFENNFL